MNTSSSNNNDLTNKVNTPAEPRYDIFGRSLQSANNGHSKVSGQYHSVKGTLVEAIGDLTGSTPWKQSGSEEHVAGEAEYQAAQAKAYVEGGIDRIAGKKDAIVGAVTGDRAQELTG